MLGDAFSEGLDGAGLHAAAICSPLPHPSTPPPVSWVALCVISARGFIERAMSHPLRFLVLHCFYYRASVSRLRSFCSEGTRHGTNGRSKVPAPTLTVRCADTAARMGVTRYVFPPNSRLAAFSMLCLL